MENRSGKVREEQYVDTKYIRERLMVSRTTAYQIMKEIEETYAPGAVIRIGRCLRAKKDVFIRWIDEQSIGGERRRGFPRRNYPSPAERGTGPAPSWVRWAWITKVGCPN